MGVNGVTGMGLLKGTSLVNSAEAKIKQKHSDSNPDGKISYKEIKENNFAKGLTEDTYNKYTGDDKYLNGEELGRLLEHEKNVKFSA